MIMGMICNLYAIIHLLNIILQTSYRFLRYSGMMKWTFLSYIVGVIFWLFVSTAFLYFPEIGPCFYIVISMTSVSGISAYYYYKALDQLERKRVMNKLIGDDEEEEETHVGDIDSFTPTESTEEDIRGRYNPI